MCHTRSWSFHVPGCHQWVWPWSSSPGPQVLHCIHSFQNSRQVLNASLSFLTYDKEILSQIWFETDAFFHDVIHCLLLGRKLRFVIKCLSSFALNFNEIKTSSGKLPTTHFADCLCETDDLLNQTSFYCPLPNQEHLTSLFSYKIFLLGLAKSLLLPQVWNKMLIHTRN